MATVFRAALVAAALCTATALPAFAQQVTPPAVAPAPATPAPQAAPAPAGPDFDAMVERLRRDLQTLTESARQGAQDVLNRKSPYVITTDQLMAVAAGAVAGAIVIDLMGGGGLATLTGAVVGGVAGHWVYTQPAMPAPVSTPVPPLKG